MEVSPEANGSNEAAGAAAGEDNFDPYNSPREDEEERARKKRIKEKRRNSCESYL